MGGEWTHEETRSLEYSHMANMNWEQHLAESEDRLVKAQEVLSQLPPTPEIRSADGRIRKGDLFVPQWWPHVRLESAVSLTLHEALGNAVYGGFWNEYGVERLVDTLPVLAKLSDTFIYGFSDALDPVTEVDAQALQDMSFSVAVQHSLLSDQPLPSAGEHEVDSDWWEVGQGFERGQEVVLGLRNVYFEQDDGGSSFRTDLLVSGPDEKTARADWQYLAGLLRPEYLRAQASQQVMNAKRAIAYQRKQLGKES